MAITLESENMWKHGLSRGGGAASAIPIKAVAGGLAKKLIPGLGAVAELALPREANSIDDVQKIKDFGKPKVGLAPFEPVAPAKPIPATKTALPQTVKRPVSSGRTVGAIPKATLNKRDFGDVVAATPTQNRLPSQAVANADDTNYGEIDGKRYYIPKDADTYKARGEEYYNGGGLDYMRPQEEAPRSIVGSSSMAPAALNYDDPAPVDVGKMTLTDMMSRNVNRRNRIAQNKMDNDDELSRNNYRTAMTGALNGASTRSHQEVEDYIAGKKMNPEIEGIKAKTRRDVVDADTTRAESPSKIKERESQAGYMGELKKRLELTSGPEADKIKKEIAAIQWNMDNGLSKKEREEMRIEEKTTKAAADLREQKLKTKNDPKAYENFKERFPDADPAAFDEYVERTTDGALPVATKDPDTKKGIWGFRETIPGKTNISYTGGGLPKAEGQPNQQTVVKLLAKYGNDPSLARLAYSRGER
jgi:hypothetical protein